MSRISKQVELEFPTIPPLTFRSVDVDLLGAEPGDTVQLAEPWSRPAGIHYCAYVPQDGTVRICCKNRTVDIIGGPKGSFGITIEQ
jgi:hypothetical protein